MSTPESSSSRLRASTSRTCNHRLTLSMLGACKEPDRSKILHRERTLPWSDRFPTLGSCAGRGFVRGTGMAALS
jgi:hypothetical protein